MRAAAAETASSPSMLKVEKGRQGQEGAEGMAKDTHPPAFCSPSVEVAEDMAMVTFPPLSRWKKGGLEGAEGAESCGGGHGICSRDEEVCSSYS